MVTRADIEIAVRGATQITNLQQQINILAKGVNTLNKTLRSGTVASIDNFNKAVTQSDRVMRAAAQGTRVQKQAIDVYVRSTIAAEKAEKSLQLAIQRRRKELGLAAATPARGGTGGASGGRLGGAISGGIIGGSFPLLFGQGGGAAAGGAIGGVAGGLLGPGGSFAGSLLGTLLGGIAAQGNKVKELANDIGFSVEQTKQLQSAFKLAGQEAEKFTEAVQNIRGLSLSIEEQANAIQLVSQLTETYGGRIDKVTNAFTSALESGKVTQATLNQLTSQGIPIQDELAKKYGVSRDAILKMAKDGQISVQTLADVLVDMGNKGIQAGEKPKTAFEQFTEALGGTITAVGNVANALLTVLGPAIDAIIMKATLALNALTETVNTELLRTQIQGQTGKVLSPEVMRQIEEDATSMASKRYPSEVEGVISPRAQQEFQILREQGMRNELQRFGYEQGILKAPKSAVSAEIGRITAPSQADSSGKTAKGPKPPKDRTAQLREEFQAIVAIGQAEDQTRDLRFQGRDILAAEAELNKQIADIERDRNKALMSANYESEKLVITKIAEARIVDANLKKEDEIRAIQQKRFEDTLQNNKAIQDGIKPLQDFRREQELQQQYGQNYLRLVMEGILPAEAERVLNFERLVKDGLHQVDIQIQAVEQQLQLAEATILEGKARELNVTALEKELAVLKAKRKAIEGDAAAGPGAGPTDRDRIQSEMSSVQGQLNTLLDPINQITLAAEGIGNAFSNSFKGIISGSMTAKEALAGFFQSVADQFLDMAAQIIAKWIQMTILNSILRLFPGGAQTAVSPEVNAIGTGSSIFAAANGATFSNGIAKFARGGIVNSPTMFQFAKGGSMATGVMGEAGPEAIMPLKRGADGKLGVMASGGGGSVNVVVNVDASGSSVQGDEPTANQLGRVISVAVQAELVKQQRPGGLLSGTR